MVGTYENVDKTLHISFVVHRPFILMIKGFFVPLYAESYGDNYVKFLCIHRYEESLRRSMGTP